MISRSRYKTSRDFLNSDLERNGNRHHPDLRLQSPRPDNPPSVAPEDTQGGEASREDKSGKSMMSGQKLEMTWKTVEYENSVDPRVWGPAFWFTLHNSSARYPVKAPPFYAERMKGFILGMPVMIPCEECADHATAHIEANYERMDEVVSGRRHLFNFFVDFHNRVNERYGKPVMGHEEAYALYTGGASVSKLLYQ